MIMLEHQLSFVRLWEEFASNPRGQRLTASPAWQAVHCACIEGSRLSTAISLWRSLWRPLAMLRREQTHLRRVSLSPSGGAPDRSAPVQVCGLAPLARLTVLLATGAPLQQSAASALPEGSHRTSCRRKTAFEIFCQSDYRGKGHQRHSRA